MNTVGELISELESFPPETPVVHHDDEEGNTVSKVSIWCAGARLHEQRAG